MHDIPRRALLGGAATLALGTAAGGQTLRHDLLIKGGEVVDPSQTLRGRRDVAIRNGLVAAVETDIPADRAAAVIDATGKLVCPGLVDLHAHVYPEVSAIGLPADELVPFTATTTYVSAGDAGSSTFSLFRHAVMARARTRLLGFCHIANFGLAGFPVGEMLNIDHAMVELAAKTAAENRDVCLGIKVRMTQEVVGNNGLEPLKRAIRAAEMAGPWARVMCHIGNAPGNIEELLDLLRPGDILTHAFSGAGNNTVQNGRVVPAALRAKQRGVVIDVGHGGGSFDYTVFEPARDQGFGPDVISSDIHAVSGNTPGLPFLPWVMSKFLNNGYSLEQVVAMATVAPARIIDRVEKLGTLQVGAPGDVSILELVREPVEFVDTRNNRRRGEQWLKPVQVVKAGRPFGRPFPSPFAWP
ncbi:amidohydrolase/deacetylase family metallohydrolase [Paracraurococcus lichenis]|uniref:Amidohydrolase/deacetylase family metallohydrolase n=1 Tax=Paracraurococcus lichenis TaxID=3064888 RepID=A0ABT9E373_9PROT|nr:amidohydrolase/deacetylase family metallohydrolase [Paracraurococcus sp. LOR1-02]MDO9710614.1 amidohydrolase/deacetylase family metallohydrolase [Paracraurococcus sp. LOR1-02]